IASTTANGFASFEPNVRIGVNSTQHDEPFTDINNNGIWDPGEPFTDTNNNGYYDPGQRAVTITYMGTQNGHKGIYTSRLNFLGNNTTPFNPDNPSSFLVGPPTLVVQQGDTINGLAGTVQNLNISDPVNNRDRGDLAFWVDTGSAQGIVRARPRQVV